MVEARVFEGTWKEVERQFHRLRQNRSGRVRVVVTEEKSGDSKTPTVTFGMFPQLLGLTDDDIKSAEYADSDPLRDIPA